MHKKIQSGFFLLSDNTDAFVARCALLSIAKKTLDIQYYIIHNDASGQYLAYLMMSAADRGVHVRILVDDINLSGRDSGLKMLSQHENIEIRIFNPLLNRKWFRNIELMFNLDRAGRRMHNKAFVTDNSTAIIGGRNIGDEYFDARHHLNFVDLDLLTIGPIVNDISHSFNDYWNSQWATPIEKLSKIKIVAKQLKSFKTKLKDKWHKARNTLYFDSLEQSDFKQKVITQEIPFIWSTAKLFYDRPEKLLNNVVAKNHYIIPQVLPYFEQAKKQLLITSPYFVPGSTGLKWFHSKKAQGIQISILTNSLVTTDVIAVHATYKKYRRELLDAGINLFELKATARNLYSWTKKLIEGSSKSSLHAKYIVIDQKYVFIGSANMDPRSKFLNTEIGIIIESEEIAQQIVQLFNKTSSPENSYQLLISKVDNKLIWLTEKNNLAVHYFYEPGASLLKKIAVFILGLLPIENLL